MINKVFTGIYFFSNLATFYFGPKIGQYGGHISINKLLSAILGNIFGFEFKHYGIFELFFYLILTILFYSLVESLDSNFSKLVLLCVTLLMSVPTFDLTGV